WPTYWNMAATRSPWTRPWAGAPRRPSTACWHSPNSASSGYAPAAIWRATWPCTNGSARPEEHAMTYDVLIVGSGLAGLATALELVPYARVAVLAKGGIEHSASHRAQGGIAAALDPRDSVDE